MSIEKQIRKMDAGIQTPSLGQESQGNPMEESFEIIASGSQCNRETVSIFKPFSFFYYYYYYRIINYIEFISKW